MAAVKVVFIPSCAPKERYMEHRYLVIVLLLSAAGRSICSYVYLCSGGNNSRHSMSIHTSSIMSEFIPKYWKGFFFYCQK